MLRKVWELILVIILLIIGFSLASEAIKPYLPMLGLGIVIIVLVASIWAAYRILSRRGLIP